ncbi:hypothetical protein L228DRAFT_263624 [Xylona heveae TC161]|uniref:Uncharacterized protein n=1 Tax=Xylona heveae (strain CBS 132557 / TC161) TaxID=1328760 RepID=A0A165A0D2_XYLHT|nr:hypothetical protein L228DRAFT_263624 [Xylona heveae TC161]KZF19771.1 hypothetical protein L228DRAFT_263624 [Xylona heveae TC161]
MDFAPYQDQAPETTRTRSPLPNGARRSGSFSPVPRLGPNNAKPPQRPIVDPWAPSARLPSPTQFADEDSQYTYQNRDAGRGSDWERDYEADVGITASGSPTGFGGGPSSRSNVDLFETSLPLRLDYEAMLAYLLLPPAGGVLLLLVEHKSDYVRFHAWQSALLFTGIFILHLLLSWSRFLSWLLFICDLALIGWLTLRAYRDADTLDRCEVPFFGRLASSFLDDE